VTRRLLAWLPAVAWAAVIFSLSAQSRLPGPSFSGFDKIAHFGAYGILGIFLCFGAERSRLPLLVAAAIGMAYGASDEIHQMFVPGRSPDVLDWCADAAGVLAACFLYTRWRLRRARPTDAAGGEASFSGA
jgi:VanZ family protein